MSLESKIDELIAALDRNTAAMTGGAEQAPAPAPAPAKPKKAASAEAVAAATAKPTAEQNKAAAAAAAPVTVTKEMIQAAGADLTTLAEIDRAAAVAILGEFGVAKMTAAPPEQIPAIHAKVKKALAERQPAAQTPSLV